MKFWAYVHNNGTLYTKRYFDEGDIIEAKESDFVMVVLTPIESDSIEEAAKIFREHCGGLVKQNKVICQKNR